VIETERLIIRVPRAHERPHMLTLFADPANERVPPAADPAQVRGWAYGVPWGIWERDTGELVGDCSLHYDTSFGAWELSYGLRRDRWGRGYATEAAQACVRHGFETMRLARIVADVDPANPASQRVLEKCGFVRVRELDDARLFYAVTRVTSSASAISLGATLGEWNLSE
jgi:ribosomal-protein-alanine N-acetyltransferase